jgi:hypothetical protein
MGGRQARQPRPHHNHIRIHRLRPPPRLVSPPHAALP